MNNCIILMELFFVSVLDIYIYSKPYYGDIDKNTFIFTNVQFISFLQFPFGIIKY